VRAQVHKQTTALKTSAQPLVSFALMSLLGLLPPVLAGPAARATGFKVSCSLSSFPGPSVPIRFCGQDVRALVVSTRPQQGVLSFSVLVSYAGQVRLALCRSGQVALDLDRVMGEFDRAVLNMQHACPLVSEGRLGGAGGARYRTWGDT
jgi:hypothetical protein